MDKLKQRALLTVAGCLAVLAAGWFLLVSPKHAEATDLHVQAASQEAANQALRTQLTVLKEQAKNLPRQQAKLAGIAAKIPSSPALPALIRALDAVSADAGVELVSIAPGAPAPVAAGAATAGGAPAGASPLSSIPLSVQVVGGYFEIQQFLRGVETTSRALRITGLTLAPGSNPLSLAKGSPAADGRSLNATLTGSAYLSTDSALTAPVTASSAIPPSAATAAGAHAPAPASNGQTG